MNHKLDRSGDIAAQIREITQRYQSLSIDVDDRALNLTAADCCTASSNAKSLSSLQTCCITEAGKAWEWLQQATKCLHVHLTNAANYQKFFHEVRHLNQRLKMTFGHLSRLDISRYNHNRHEECTKKTTEEIKEILSQLLDLQAKIDSLCEKSGSIVPVHLRKLPLKAPLSVIAIATYSQNKVKIEEDETYVLLDNTDPAKWKIKTKEGCEIWLLSLIFVIPPPDREALSNAHRLRQELLTSWKSYVSGLKFDARALLSQYLGSRDKREMSCLNEQQRTSINECIGDGLGLLGEEGAKAKDVLAFRNLMDTWKDNIKTTKPSQVENKNLATRLQNEWLANKKFIRQIQEFETYVVSYDETLSTMKETKHQVVNGDDLSSLKYISVAYIQRWPKNDQSNSTSVSLTGSAGHLIMTEKVPIFNKNNRFTSQIEADLDEIMSETVSQEKEVSEMTQQTIHETERYMIRGVVDPRNDQEISIYEAVTDKVVDQARGIYRNPVTGESMPIQEAMQRGLIRVEYVKRSVEMGELIKSGIIKTITTKETVTYHVLSIKDPRTGLKMSVDEAIRRGVVDQNSGRYVIDVKTGESISIPTAIDKGFLEVEVIDRKSNEDKADGGDSLRGRKDLLVDGVYDPVAKRNVSLEEAIRRGLVEPEKGVYVNPATRKPMSVEDAVERGYLSVRLVSPGDVAPDDGRLLGRRLVGRGADDVQDMVARRSTTLANPLQVDIVAKLRNAKELETRWIKDPTSGKKISVSDALLSGLINIDPLSFNLPDGTKCTVFEAARRGLIDAKTVREILNSLEPYSLQSYVTDNRIDPVNGQFLDPTTGQYMSLAEAIEKGRLDPGSVFYTDVVSQSVMSLKTAIKNKKFDPESGRFVDPKTGKRLTMAEAIKRNLISADVEVDAISARVSAARVLAPLFESDVCGIRNPQTGEDMSVEDAVLDGILDLENMEYVDLVSKTRMPLAEAVSLGHVTPETAKKILAAMSRLSLEDLISRSQIDLLTGKFVDPETKRKITIKEALENGALDPGAVFLTDPSSGLLVSLARLIRDGRFNPETGRFRDTLTGLEVSIATAVKQGTIVPGLEADAYLDGGKTALKDLLDGRKLSQQSAAFVLPSGETVSLKEAIAAGYVSADTVVKVDPKTGNVVLGDGSEDVVQCLVDTKRFLDWLNEIEISIAKQEPISDDVNQLQQLTKLNEDLKLSLDGQKKAMATVLTSGQRLIDGNHGNVQQNQRLKCNITDFRMRFDEVNSQLTGKLDQLKSISSDVTHFDDDFKKFDGWIEKTNQGFDEMKTELKKNSNFDPTRKRLQNLNDEIQMKDGQLQSINVSCQKIVNSITVFKEASRKFADGLQNQNIAPSYVDSTANVNRATDIATVNDRFGRLKEDALSLASRLEQAEGSDRQFQELKKEVERLIPTLEDETKRCGAAKDGGGLQDAIDRMKDVTVQAMEVGKRVKELRDIGDGLVYALDEMDLSDCPKSQRVQADLDRVQADYDRVQETIVERQHELSKAAVQSQDAHHNLALLLQWVKDGEDHLDQLKSVSLDRSVLTNQIQDHQVFSSEIENRRPRVNAVVDQCQSEGADERVDELLDRFDALRSKNDARGQELEDVVRKLTDLHASVDQMESWLTGAVQSLKRSGSGGDQSALRTKIESLYVQKQSKQADLEKIKAIGRELIEDPTTGDKHHLRETITDMQAKWHDLTELLVQMISYSALMEIDDLLKYLDRAENEMNTADVISIDPEALAVQLRDHKAFHEDLKNKRRAVNATIDKCNTMLRETTNEEADDIKNKLNIIRGQADLVFRLSNERCRALEEALPLVNHFCDARTDLQSWLNELEAEVNSMEVDVDGSLDQIKKQLENAKATLRIIDDHKTLMQDLVATGQDLMDICSEEDGHDIRQDLHETMVKYNDVKAIARQKMNLLADRLQAVTTELPDCLDNLADELYYIDDQAQHVDPINVNPNVIREQIAENQTITEDFDHCIAGMANLRANVDQLLRQEPNENIEELKELDGKLQELSGVWESVHGRCQTRAERLEETVDLADRFQQEYLTAVQTLQGIKDNLLSQDVSGIDQATVREQQKELQSIQDELQSCESLIGACRNTADKLGAMSGGPGAVELQKHLEDMDRLIEDITDGVKDRDAELASALEKSENCYNFLETVLKWLPRSEDALRKMVPPTENLRSVQNQAEELKRFKVETEGRQSDVLELNHYTSALKNLSPMAAESLMAEVKEVNDRWSHLLAGIAERERALNVKIVDLGGTEAAMDGVMGMLVASQRKLTEMDAIRGDGKVMEECLRKLQVLQKDLANQEPVIQRVNDSVQRTTTDSNRGHQTTATLNDKCRDVNNLHAVVTITARDKQNRLQDSLKEFKTFVGKVEDLTRWMNEYRIAIVSSPPLAALSENAEHQLNDFKAGYLELEKKEAEVKAVLLEADDNWGQCPEKDTIALRECLSMLQNRTYVTRAKAEKQKGRMEEHLRNVKEFHAMLRVHTDWLSNAEMALSTLKHPSKLVERVLQQISEHKLFRQSLDEHSEMMSEIDYMGAFLKHFGGRQDSIYVQTLLMTIKVRWRKLVRRVEDKGRVLAQAYQEDKKFYDEWKSMCDWLDTNEQRLKKVSLVASAKVKQDIDELQHFQQQMTSKQASYHSASRLGRNLKDRCTKADPEREILNAMLEELKRKWNSLRSIMTQRQSKLDEALLSTGRFSDAMNSLVEWLTKAELYLREDQPVLGDLDTVTILIEHHKAFQQELASRQGMLEAIRNCVGSDTNVSAQLEDLNALWDRVNQLSDSRDYRLQDALKLAEDFQEVVQVVREWLPQAEAELKFRAMPEDEDGIVQLLENHERFQEDLRAQQPNIEKIAAMADEILHACHPSAVRFVRYYLTITQTRWEQAVNRSNQRTARLQEALRNMRGNAALLEDLLSWLTEAHALLAAKERDPIPDDLTIVEVLVKEHLEFHEDLCMKNKDVERLTKAPSNNARWHLHGSSWKLNDHDSMSPRVTTLQNKWRIVWRISVDRKKHLQDMLDQLLELESFKNFDFDIWRQRYVAWNRSKKLRITDFFRRQDKNGYGTLTRDQFINGMLISKFPTNRTELNAVFDIFDRNRTGEIHYNEFIEALRPERQHGGRRSNGRAQTDSDLIHDEIEQQASHCQCRHQFAVDKMGEGKYRLGEKGKMCLVRYLNSTVMVRVGGGWVTLSSFLDNNDPCRVKGRLNTDLRETLTVGDDNSSSSAQARLNSNSRRRPSTPNTPALDNRLSGSASSLSSVGKSSFAKDRQTDSASRRSSNLAKSCTNLSGGAGSGSGNKGLSIPEGQQKVPAPKKPSNFSSPRPVKRSGSSSSSSAVPRQNGATNGRETPTGGTRTSSASKTPTGSRSGSPTPNPNPNRKQPAPINNKLLSVKQNMKF